jgi:pimeloyl-ACP methyl ester carboxylesterase
MSKILSRDGTEIAYDKQGQGSAVILVDGALAYRSFGTMPELAKLLSKNFTVVNYDRRGRGESSDNKSFTIDREIEDIEALIDVVGGSACLYGVSSGGCLRQQSNSETKSRN